MGNKGITLIEIIISVGLISVVMLFLFNLLLDMEHESTYSSYLKENQVNRSNIIRTVEEDLLNNKLNDVRLNEGENESTVEFDFGSFVTRLIVEKDRITYKEDTWLLEKGGNEGAYYDFANIKISKSDDNNCSYTLNIDSDNDGVCNYNCDTNSNGVLDDSERSTVNEAYKACSSYRYVRVIVPAVASATTNIIDDLEFFYIGLK